MLTRQWEEWRYGHNLEDAKAEGLHDQPYQISDIQPESVGHDSAEGDQVLGLDGRMWSTL